MGLEIVIDPEGEDETALSLASSLGWSDLCDWATVLDQESYPDLYMLCDEGAANSAQAVAGQLKAAIEDSPPDNPEIDDTARDLIENLDGRGDVPLYVTT